MDLKKKLLEILKQKLFIEFQEINQRNRKTLPKGIPDTFLGDF